MDEKRIRTREKHKEAACKTEKKSYNSTGRQTMRA